MTTGSQERSDRSLGALLASITEDLSALIRGEIELAKAEAREAARNAAKGFGLFAVALALIGSAGFLLLFAAVYGIVAAGLPVWAGFLIVAAVLVVVALILAAVGKKSFDAAKAPKKVIEQREATRRVLASVPQRFQEATERAAADSTPPPAPPA
jgi:hypothetical protein